MQEVPVCISPCTADAASQWRTSKNEELKNIGIVLDSEIKTIVSITTSITSRR